MPHHQLPPGKNCIRPPVASPHSPSCPSRAACPACCSPSCTILPLTGRLPCLPCLPQPLMHHPAPHPPPALLAAAPTKDVRSLATRLLANKLFAVEALQEPIAAFAEASLRRVALRPQVPKAEGEAENGGASGGQEGAEAAGGTASGEGGDILTRNIWSMSVIVGDVVLSDHCAA